MESSYNSHKVLEHDNQFVELAKHAEQATRYLKAFAQEGRLMILCHLAGGEKCVKELEALLALRQTSVSQQLARLRMLGIIKARRSGKSVYYRLSDKRAEKIVSQIHQTFCYPES